MRNIKLNCLLKYVVHHMLMHSQATQYEATMI